MNRFWFATLSGTILKANPSDIAGPMDIICSEVWDNQKHPYHPFSRSELKKLGRIFDKSIEGQGDPKAQANAQECIKAFGQTLPHFSIRRY